MSQDAPERKWFRIPSSNIKVVAWTPETLQLSVVFNKSEAIRYIYDKVPREVYLTFLHSDFPGSYFARAIRGKFSFTTQRIAMEEQVIIAEAKSPLEPERNSK